MSTFVERLKQGQEPAYERRIRAATGLFRAIAGEIHDMISARPGDEMDAFYIVAQLNTSADFVDRFLPPR